MRRRQRSSGLGRRPAPPDPLGPGSRSPRGQGSRNFRMSQQPCLPAVGLITLTPRCCRRCPRRRPGPSVPRFTPLLVGMGQDAPSQLGNRPCNLLSKDGARIKFVSCLPGLPSYSSGWSDNGQVYCRVRQGMSLPVRCSLVMDFHAGSWGGALVGSESTNLLRFYTLNALPDSS